ncbi:MAG: hypothetical protein J6U95_04995 [Alistipes sp.]|nr:hypothetical protein [Alistipes sp.]
MKKLLSILTLSLFLFEVSAQTKVAYCDVYARGGGLNLTVTISFDNKSYDFYETMNIGEVLNIMATDGWVLDRDIVIPRHPFFSLFTRHKLHFIMKKEYQKGENPFAGIINRFSSNTTNSGSPIPAQQEQDDNSIIEYKGVKAIKGAIINDKIILLATEGKVGTWVEATEHCKSLGSNWRLPTIDEIKKVKRKLQDNAYWTNVEVNENRAKYYAYSYNEAYNSNKTSTFYIQPIAIVDVNELK